MELLPLGPVMIIDTPGFDDKGHLGELRVRKTKKPICILSPDVVSFKPIKMLPFKLYLSTDDFKKRIQSIFIPSR